MTPLSAQDSYQSNMTKSPIQGLRTVGYLVPDLDSAKEWYSKAFNQVPYFDEPYYVGFNIGGYELGLMPVEGEVKTADNVLCYWGVDDIHEVYEHLITIGAKTHEAPHSVGEPLMVASVKDPWGNLIGLIYNPVFKVE